MGALTTVRHFDALRLWRKKRRFLNSDQDLQLKVDTRREPIQPALRLVTSIDDGRGSVLPLPPQSLPPG